MNNIAYLVPLFPLLGFLINGLFRKSLSKGTIGIIGCGTILLSFIVSLILFFDVKANGGVVVNYFNFIDVASFQIPFAFQIDQLSVIFLLIITGIGFLIHLYSTSYMHDESSEHFGRYFAYLNLFVFSMLLLIMGANYVIMFIGWEGVGLCSYLLIGYWFKNINYTNAAKKAFVMNRIGDLGFLLAVFWLLSKLGTANYVDVFEQASTGLSSTDVTAITLLLFVGAMGKSAQIPLYTWLPDAMAGPTPVSALIHAATMVTAGIYMIARSNVLYSLSPLTQDVVAVIGLATAILSATIALFQNDIKKVLAYSTVSQLGFMFLALGVGAYTTGVFHVMTHAFFKALMFLGAGSVIHAMGGEQDITKMGGLVKKLPITAWTFVIGVLAISGFPFTSGFVSKDEILLAVLAHSPVLFWFAVFAAILTAAYMFRLMMLVFFGGFRGTHEQEHHLHESPSAMTIPLIILGVLSLIGGFVQLPHVFGGEDFFNQFLAPIVPAVTHEGAEAATLEYYLLGGTIVILVIVYVVTKKLFAVDRFDGVYTGFKKVLADKWYIDELYNAVIVNPLDKLAGFLKNVVEKSGIDGIVNGVGKFVNYASRQLRLLQSGQVGNYILFMVLSIAVLFLVFWNQEIIVQFLQKIF
ncbi:NADH-quinone oxidoreductase subunit L [Limnovirga soli]|uniref:NADH-quinone oxidoreductase subunit L n=1 Tax=Limnovirga soli TaxID=2656915 RepID=A0A8J8FGS8_9BACT|nr:NADH-quinone oxidoreductase subunit L [Limnovirga soli]NNV54804.1 NADH-quinone oxidoreductase subunit L [Limnovirga soli]